MESKVTISHDKFENFINSSKYCLSAYLPFFAPESVTSAPEAVRAVPFSSSKACSYRIDTEPFLDD